MCGSNNQQQDTYDQQAEFSKQMMAENAAVYGKQQGILDSLNAGFQKIVDAGPSQRGFSDDEKNDLDTQATEAVGANMSKAAKALGEGQAAQGGGDTFIPSGVKDQQREELAATGASTDASLHSQINEDDYAAGRTNYNNAVQGELGTAQLLSPTSYGSVTNDANSGQASEANAIAASANAPFAAVMGALGGIGGAAAGAYTGGLAKACWVAAEVFGGWNDPRTVDVRIWLTTEFCKTLYGAWLVAVYLRHGEWMAAQVRRYPLVRRFFTKVFNCALRQARKEK